MSSHGSVAAVGRVSGPFLREPTIAYGVFAVVVAAVVLWWAPMPAMRIPVTAIVLVVLFAAGFEGLRRRTAREFLRPTGASSNGAPALGSPGSYEFVRERTASGAWRSLAARRRSGTMRPAGASRLRRSPTRVDRLERLARLRDTGALEEHKVGGEEPRILGGAGAPARPWLAGRRRRGRFSR